MVRRQDRSLDRSSDLVNSVGSGNVNVSSRSQDVVEGSLSSSNRWADFSSLEDDLSGSSNVEDDLGILVASVEDVVSDVVEVGVDDVDAVRKSSLRGASDGHGSPLDSRNSVGLNSGESLGQLSVESLGVVEVSVELVRSGGVGSSRLDVIRGNNVSSDEGILSNGRVSISSSSKRVDFSVLHGEVSVNNEGIGEDSVDSSSLVAVDFVTDRISVVGDNHVTLDCKSSFNIRRRSVEVSKVNNVEVISEGVFLSVQFDSGGLRARINSARAEVGHLNLTDVGVDSSSVGK